MVFPALPTRRRLALLSVTVATPMALPAMSPLGLREVIIGAHGDAVGQVLAGGIEQASAARGSRAAVAVSSSADVAEVHEHEQEGGHTTTSSWDRPPWIRSTMGPEGKHWFDGLLNTTTREPIELDPPMCTYDWGGAPLVPGSPLPINYDICDFPILFVRMLGPFDPAVASGSLADRLALEMNAPSGEDMTLLEYCKEPHFRDGMGNLLPEMWSAVYQAFDGDLTYLKTDFSGDRVQRLVHPHWKGAYERPKIYFTMWECPVNQTMAARYNTHTHSMIMTPCDRVEGRMNLRAQPVPLWCTHMATEQDCDAAYTETGAGFRYCMWTLHEESGSMICMPSMLLDCPHLVKVRTSTSLEPDGNDTVAVQEEDPTEAFFNKIRNRNIFRRKLERKHRKGSR